MSKLIITEYSALASAPGGGSAPVGREPSSAVHAVEIGLETKVSKGLQSTTSFVRLISDEDVRISFGNGSQEVDQSSTLLPAGMPEYFGVSDGARRIAVVRSA